MRPAICNQILCVLFSMKITPFGNLLKLKQHHERNHLNIDIEWGYFYEITQSSIISVWMTFMSGFYRPKQLIKRKKGRQFSYLVSVYIQFEVPRCPSLINCDAAVTINVDMTLIALNFDKWFRQVRQKGHILSICFTDCCSIDL